MARAFKELGLDATPLAAAVPAFCVSIPAGELRGVCEQSRARKARLVALWGSDESTRRAGYALHLALAFPAGLLWVSVPLSREDPHYPGIADIYPSANRMQANSNGEMYRCSDSASSRRRMSIASFRLFASAWVLARAACMRGVCGERSIAR